MSGWASIVNASEGDFNKLSEAIVNSDGVAQSMSDTMMQGMNGALTEMKSALEGVAITIGERLTPFIEKIADGVSKLCDWFKNLSPTTQTVIMVIAGLVACIGPLLMLVGSGISLFANLSIVAGGLGVTVGALVGAFSSVIGIVVAVVGAIAGFIAIIVNAYKENETFRSTVNNVFNNIKSIISNVMSVIKDVISMAWSVIKTIWNNGLKQILQFVLTTLATMASNFTSSLNKVTSIVKTAISLIKAVFSGDFKSVGSIVNNILQSVVNAFNNKMNQARNAVNNAIQKIKSIMNFSWSLPKLKLPRISISGKFSLSPPSVPKFGISWYSRGAIFKRPTVLGGMGVGDRHNGIGSNAEAILPINQLPKLLGLDKMQEDKNNAPIVVNTVLDGKTIAQTIASYSDVISANRMNLTERGLVL